MAMITSGKRAALLTGCAMAAAMAGQAHAQAIPPAYPDRGFQGDPTVASGDVSIQRVFGTQDNITINSPTAIINWNPETGGALPPGVIDFLPEGHIGAFLGGIPNQDFTVLNRILPSDSTRAISLNGHIASAISDGQGNYNPGGSVWFYTPGGIIVGSTAQFDVGNLVLTTSDIDATNGLLDENDGRLIKFRGIEGSTSLIDIKAGATLNLTTPGSYLAVVAPQVFNAGNITTAGSVAYIAVQSVDVRINSGLFDINFVSGTDATGQVLTHIGDTSSPEGEYGSNGIYLAAMPKNQAISILLGGTIGYQPAASASSDNGTIVLSAGYNVQNGEVQTDNSALPNSSITIGAITANSSVNAFANDKITVGPDSDTVASFTSQVRLVAGTEVSLTADSAEIGIGGSLRAETLDKAMGGTVSLIAKNGGTVDVTSDLTLTALGAGRIYDLIGEEGIGGTVNLSIDNGRIAVGGDTQLSANAQGGSGQNVGGAARGGTINVSIANSDAEGGFTSGSLNLSANGNAGEAGYGAGGAGTGGTISVTADGARLQASGTGIHADGFGGNGYTTGAGGLGTGGNVSLSIANTEAQFSSLELSASSEGGTAQGAGTGGAAIGGIIDASIDNATVNVSEGFQLTANTLGGESFEGAGGAATGRSITLGLSNDATLTSDLTISTEAVGGEGGLDSDFDDDGIADAFGTGGAAKAGDITLNVAGTILAPFSVQLLAQASGGTGAEAGNAIGGNILIDFTRGLIDPRPAGGSFVARVDAIGGGTDINVNNPSVFSAHGGDAQAGTITLTQGTVDTAADFEFTTMLLSATAQGMEFGYGDVGNQGTARGGTITANLINGNLTATDGLTLDARGTGTVAYSVAGGSRATGGAGVGGTIALNVGNVAIDASSVSLLAGGQGGNGGDYDSGGKDLPQLSAAGGRGQGGTATLVTTGGSFNGSISLGTAALGGNGGNAYGENGAAGGNAVAGQSRVTISANTSLSGDVSIFSKAVGGGGGSSYYCGFFCNSTPPFVGGKGGDATAKAATFSFAGSESSVGPVVIDASATGGGGGSSDFGESDMTLAGGFGGAGGVATGADATVTFSGNASYNSLYMLTSARGGDGGTGPGGGVGGAGSAGKLSLNIDNIFYSPTGLTLDATARGGVGGNSGFATGAAGGNAAGGTIEAHVTGANGSLTMSGDGPASFSVTTNGGGGGSSYGQSNDGGAGGSANGGTVNWIADQGSIDGFTSYYLTFNMEAIGGSGAEGGYGANGGGTGGNGGAGGDATAGQLSITALAGGSVSFGGPNIELGAYGGGGGYGGFGGYGTNGVDGENGAIGQNGGAGTDGGAGGLGGNGARGGNATGGIFTLTSSSNGFINLGELDLNLVARAGRSGDGGQGGYGGYGGYGGTGGNGEDLGGGNITPPGIGGNGGNGGVGGNGGTGGAGANAVGGSATIDAFGGTINTASLSIRANAQGRFGGTDGYIGFGGSAGEGGSGGFDVDGGQANGGDRGFDGGEGQFGTRGIEGTAQGGLIAVGARNDGASAGMLQTLDASFEATAQIFDGEGGPQRGLQGQIDLSATGAGSVLQFTSLDATTGDLQDDGTGGAIRFAGTDATLDLGSTTLTSTDIVSVALNGTAKILAGSNFAANARNAITVSHAGLPMGVDTVSANTITLRSGGSVQTSSARLGATNLIDIAAVNNVALGDAHVAGGSISVDGSGPHGAEIRVAAGANPLGMASAPHPGNLTTGGMLDATGSIALSASNDVTVTAAARIGSNNRIALLAGGDVTVATGASISAGRSPQPETGYGVVVPFNQNGMLTVRAGQPSRAFAVTPGDIGALVIGGTLDAGNGSMILSGAAIDGTGSTATAKYFRADIAGATSGGSNDLGRLSAGCTEGSICLGTLAVSGLLQVGTIGQPLTLDIAKAGTSDSIDLRALGNIRIGDGSAFTVQATTSFQMRSVQGDIVLVGPVTLRGPGNFTLAAGGSLVGPQASVISTGNLIVTAPGGISLAMLSKVGDLNLSSSSGLSFAQLSVTPGAAITLTSTLGPVFVGNIGTPALGKPGSITVNAGGAVTLTHAETSGRLLVNGASFMTGLNSIITGGDIDLTVTGLADLGNSQAGGHAMVSADDIVFNSLTTLQDYVSLGATSSIVGGTVNSAATTSATGGTGVNIATLVSTGAVDLTSATGAILIGTQLDAPTITATGRSVTLVSNKLITAPNLNATAGALSVNAASYSGGSASATGAVSITAPGGISLTNLNAGAASILSAANGAILVSSNISAPSLDAQGRSVTLRGTGALTGISGAATAGDFDVQAAGNLALATVSDADNLIAKSTGGSITLVSATTDGAATLTANGTITGGTLTAATAALTGPNGITLTGLTTTGSTSLAATNGAIDIASLSSGSLAAQARSIKLRGAAALSASNLNATAGGIDVQTGGNLAVGTATATTTLRLVSDTGAVGFTSANAGGAATIGAATTVSGGTLSATSASVTGLTGVTLTGLSVGTTATLTATNGAINASGISAGNVIANARAITLSSPTTLNASQVTSTVGDVDLTGASLALGTVNAASNLIARAQQGSITFTSAQAVGNATLMAASTVTGTTLSAGGNAGVTAPGGITIANAISTGTGNYSAANGAIDLANVAASALTATARSVQLRAPGALNITNAQATAGMLDVQTGGALTITNGSASQQLLATSMNGALNFGTLSAGAGLTLTAGDTVTGTTAVAGGNAVISGANGIDIASLTAGPSNTANLSAIAGAVRVTSNLSALSVDAQGRSIYLRTTGPLAASQLIATAGGVDVRATMISATTVQASGAADLVATSGGVAVNNDLRATSGTVSGTAVTLRSLGSLSLTSAQASAGATDIRAANTLSVGNAGATGALTLRSTSGALAFNSATAGVNATLVAATTITGGTLTANGNATLTAPNGITLTGLQVAGTSQLTATNGLVDVSGLVGSNLSVGAQSIKLAGAGGFTATSLTATNGLLDLNFGGNVNLGSANATTTLNLTSGGTLQFNSLSGGGAATLNALNVNGGTLSAASASVVGTNGITLTGLTVGGTGTLNAANGAISATGVAASNVIASARSIALTAPGALTASSLTATNGGLTLRGTSLALGTTSATGATDARASNGAITLTAVAGGGDATLIATSTITGGTVSVGGNATLTAPNGITLTGLSSGGTSQLNATNGLVDVASIGGGSVGVDASSIRLAGLNAFTATTLTATGGLLDLNFGGDINLGSASAATTLSLTSGGTLSFASLTSGGNAALSGLTVTGGTSASGGSATVSGANGLTLTGLSVVGTGTLNAANGAIDASGIGAGNYVATARSIRLRGTGALNATGLNATAGAIDVASANSLAIGDAIATGGLTLASTNGDLTATSLTGGATALTAANGAIDANGVAVTSLDATGKSVRLRGNGALAANTLAATNGALDVRFGGAASIANASGTTTTISTGTGDLTIATLSGGAATLGAGNGALTVLSNSASDVAAVGASIAITSPGTLNASFLIATGGDITLRGAALNLSAATASGALDARSSNGGLSFATLNAAGNATLVSATTATGTTLTAGGAISVTAPGGIDIANLRAVGAAALNSSGAIRVSTDLAASDLTASGASLFLRSLGSVNASSLVASSGTVDIGTAGALNFGTLNSAGATSVAAGTTVAGTTLVSGGATTITAPSGITLQTLRSTGTATLTAPNGPVRVGTEVAANNLILDAGSIFLRTPGALTLGQVRAASGDVDIAAVGNLSVTNASASGAVTLAANGGNLTVGSIGGQLNPLTAALSATGAVTLGDAAARSTLSVVTPGLATFNGALTAPTIALSSGDIAVGAQARLGTLGTTTQLTLTSTASTATIGGSAAGTGYRLTEAELLRAFANNIAIVASPAGQQSAAIDPNATPTLVLDTMSLAAGGQIANLGTSGTLRFQTRGTLRVTGAVKLTGANATNRVELVGPTAVQVRPGGSVSLVNGTDLAGTLFLQGEDVIASDAATLTALGTAANAKAQSDLLGVNTNPQDDTGYFAAGAIVANVGHGFYVQNSGASQAAGATTYDLRRGLTVGSGGLTVTASGQTPVTVAVNGRQVSTAASGGFLTGLSFVPVVTIGTASGGTTLTSAGSTINGCAIGSVAACSPSPVQQFNPETIIEPGSVARDTIEAGELVADALEAAANAINRPVVLVELPGFSALVGQPLIEEPVTGSGNDDLLADKDGKSCDPSTETCTKD